jgi:hypothetical protein
MKTRKRGAWFAWLILLTALSLGTTHTGFAQESTDDEGETSPTDASATTTPATTPTDASKKPDDKKKAATSIAQAQAAGLPTNVDRDWQISLSSSLGVGSGAFVDDANARRTRVRFGLDFGGSYTIPNTSLNISASTGFTQWLSRGSNSDQQEPQLFRWSDSSISFFHPIYAFDFGLRFMGNLSFVIPTSTASQQTNLYTTVNPTLIVLQRFGNLTFQYVLDYSHNFNKYTSTVYDPSEVDILSRNGGTEQLNDGLVASSGVLNEITLFNSFGVNYNFFDSFLFSIRFGFADFWTYDNGTITEADEFTSPYADSSRGHGQSSFGVLRFTYNPSNYLSAAISMSTQQPWKTRDNQGYRFPFFDFESPANNFTNFNLVVTAFY